MNQMDHESTAMDHSHHQSTTMDHSHHQSTTMDPNHDHSGSGDTHHMMAMYFHTNIGTDYVLLKNWKPDTIGDMLWTCSVLFLLAIAYEGLKYYREYLMNSWKVKKCYNNDTLKSNKTGDNSRNYGTNGMVVNQNPTKILKIIFSFRHSVQTILHVFQFFISYVLMLVFMTYNVYFVIAILLGAGVGYFLFGWNKSTAVDITEHCH